MVVKDEEEVEEEDDDDDDDGEDLFKVEKMWREERGLFGWVSLTIFCVGV